MIDPRLSGEHLLRVLIHEQLHAADWDKSEEWVDEVSRDIARNLWRLGWRNDNEL